MSKVDNSFYVGGEWRKSSVQSAIRHPWDDSRVGDVFLASDADIEDAVSLAIAGFEKTKILSSFERAEILRFIAGHVRDRQEIFAQLITAEIGKPIHFSRIEVERAIFTLQLAGEEAKRISGDLIPLDLLGSTKNRFGIVRRFPIGIVLGIIPFNFPLNLVAHKLGPAIASGNSFLLKPPPQAPLTSLLLAKIVQESGFPKEAFSTLPCKNSTAERLVADERIKMLSFTGSPQVGWLLKSKAGRKKVILELGGNAGVIIDKSATIEDAVRKNVIGAFAYGGQTCIKVQRIFVHREISDKYIESFVKETRNLKVGDPHSPETIVGPLIDKAAAERVISWVKESLDHGAEILCGGRSQGCVVEPTVLLNVRRTEKVFCNEIFGPVVTIHPFDTLEEAVAGVNDSAFGLQAGIFTNDFKNILYAYDNIEAGGVVVNDNPTFRIDNMPYGGTKQSGLGREGLKYAIEEMTEPKLLAINPN